MSANRFEIRISPRSDGLAGEIILRFGLLRRRWRREGFRCRNRLWRCNRLCRCENWRSGGRARHLNYFFFGIRSSPFTCQQRSATGEMLRHAQSSDDRIKESARNCRSANISDGRVAESNEMHQRWGIKLACMDRHATSSFRRKIDQFALCATNAKQERITQSRCDRVQRMIARHSLIQQCCSGRQSTTRIAIGNRGQQCF